MTSLWRHLWPNYNILDFKTLTQCVKLLGERVLQVWWWYLHWFRRYCKKTRGGARNSPPPVGRGLSWAWVARASATTLVASSTVAARGVTVASDDPALASSSAFEFPRISTCPGIHKNRIEMPLTNVDKSVCWISQTSLFDEDLFRIDISEDLESEQTTEETMPSFSIWWTTCWMAKSFGRWGNVAAPTCAVSDRRGWQNSSTYLFICHC